MAQLPGYTSRLKLQVDFTQVSGSSDLTNFPVLVSITLPELATGAGIVTDAQGDDIVFTAANGSTILSHQRESYNSGTGAIEYWVRFPTLSTSVNTDFYIHFGNASITTDQSSTNVWDSNYKLVMHMDETGSGGINFTDAAGEVSFSDISDNATTATTGQIGGARLFTDPGTGDLITIADNGVSPLDISGNITISMWVQITNLASGPDIISKGTYTDGYGLWVNGSGSLRFQINNSSLNSSNNAIEQDGTWDYITITRASNGDRFIYSNGTQVANDNNAASFEISDDDLFLSTSSFDYEGGMDEVRVSNITRSLDWHITEYNNQANPGTFLSEINTEPVLTNIEGATITFNSGDSPTLITSTLTIADGNDADIESAVVAITANFNSSEDVLTFVDQNGISGSYASGTGILSLSGSATIAEYQTALQSITYQNTAISPAELTRTISFTIEDDEAAESNTETRDIDIVKVNNASILSAIETSSVIYFEGNGTKLLTSSLLVSDADDINLESATVSITSGFNSSEDVLAFIDANGITGSYASGTGILSLSGTASIAAYQSALRSVTYENTGSPLNLTTRTIEFIVNDGTENSSAVTRNIEYPEDITELTTFKSIDVFHYDAQDADGDGDSGTNQPADGALAAWGDRTVNAGGTSNDLTATTTGGQEPTLDSNLLGGRTGLFFDGVNESFNPPNDNLLNTASYTEKSFAMMFRTGNSVTGLQVMFEQGGGTRGYQLSIKDGFAYAVVWNNNEWSGGDQYKSINLGSVSTNTSYIIIASHDATAVASVDQVWEGNMNGGAITTLTDVDFQRAHSGGAEIGEEDGTIDPTSTSNANPSGTSPYGGTIAEFISWNNALTTTDFTNLFAYLSDKWFNTPSVLSNIEVAPLTYNEGNPATSITSSITISDEDDTDLDSAKVYISSNYESTEDVLAYATALGITGTYDSPTGILTLTGTTTVANYQTALRNVTYQNTGTGASITESTRELSFIVYDWDDSSSVITRNIDVIPDNDIPTITTIEPAAIVYAEGVGAVQTTATIVVSDTDNTNLQGATVAFSNNYFLGEDVLDFVDGFGITSSFDELSGVLTLSGTTTVGDYESALRAVTYENTSADPVELSRTIQYRVYDGIDSSLVGFTRDIDVSASNTAPTISNIESTSIFYPVGDSINVSETITIIDPDNVNITGFTFDIGANFDNTQDTLVFQALFGITSSWDDVNGILALSGTATKSDYQAAIRTVRYASTDDTPEDLARTITLQANDGTGLSNTLTRTVSFSIPKSVDDLLVWLKGDAGVLTSGSNVTSWEDQSGNGNNFTATNNPQFVTSVGSINSQNAIEFDGTSGMNLVDDDAENYLNGLDGFTIFFVIESDIIDTDQGFWTTTTPNGTDDVFTIRYDDVGDNGSGLNVIKTGMRDLPVAFAQESFEDAQTTSGQIVMLKWTSEQNYELYVDGVLSNPTFLLNIPTGTLQGVTTAIIGQGEQDAASSWDGLIAEMILYGEEIELTEQEDIEDYLSTKYGIAIRSLTAATGGEAISADDASIAPSPAYTTLTGPRVQESFAGEFTSGGTFIFNAPTGFEWDDTGLPAPSASVQSAFGGSTSLSVQTLTSRSTSQIVFTIDTESTSNPGEIIFADFRVRPTTGTLPNVGNITNTGTTGSGGSTNYGVLTMVAGNQIEMEFAQQPAISNIGSPISPSVRVQLIDQFGNPVLESRVEIEVALNAGANSGTLAGTSLVESNVFGISEYTDISVGTVPGDAGTYSLTATSSPLTPVDSDDFDVVVLGELTQFVVERIPSGNISDKLAGQSFNITIVAVDGAQDTVKTFTGTIGLTSNCTIGSGGGTSASFVEGVLASKTVSISSLGSCILTATNTAGSETGDSNSFEVTPGAASVATSTISATPSVILNDGFSTSTIIVQLKDSEGNNRTIGGETVVLSTTDGSIGVVTDNADGTYSATLTSSVVAGTATISGTLDAVAITNDAEVEFAAFNNLWQSSVGSVADARNWDLATNWSSGSVPVPADKVLIPVNPAVGNEQPVINTTNTTILQLSIESGASVTVSGGKELIVTGELSGDGVVNGSNTDSVTVGGDLNISDMSVGYVTLDGTVNQDVNSPNDYSFLTLDNVGGADFFSSLTVSDSLKLINGTLFMPSGTNLIANKKEYENGLIRMQREITGSRGWRLISSPIDTTYDVFLNNILTQGYSGSTLGDAPLDSLQPNILTYLENTAGTDNQRYRTPTSNLDRPSEGQGMFAYIFGDIAADSRYNDALPDTIDVIGREFEGDGTEVDFGITYLAEDPDNGGDGWNLVGNPFLATIDWDDNSNWTKTNVESTIYIWDPASNGGDGEYLTWNGVTGTLPTGGLIAPFQAFWVKANASSPDLKVNLDAKTTSGGFLGKVAANEATTDSTQEKRLDDTYRIIELAVTSSENRSKKTTIMFSDEGEESKDALDAYRLLPFSNSHIEFHTLLEDGSEFAINNLPINFNSRNFIPLHVDAFEDGVPVSGQYTIVWNDLRTIPDDWIITLLDNDTGEEINLLEETSYTFNHSTNSKLSTNNSANPLTPNYAVSKKAKSQATRFTLKVSTEDIERDVPEEIFLSQNYPNPFNPTTLIPFGINEDSNVELIVYDILGRKVQTLVNGPRTPGRYEVRFNAGQLASGVYFYRLVTDSKVLVKRFTLIK